MDKKVLLIDLDQCVRCFACEIACKQENDLPVGPRWMQIATIEPRKVQDTLHLDFVPLPCLHCDDPPCAHFCPTGAIKKRDDGIVLIEKESCDHCQLCMDGCPYGRIFRDEETGTVGKCNLCVDRIDFGLQPTCVQHCIGGALQLVTEKESRDITEGQHSVRMGAVCYTSTKWKLNAGA